jgi:hypothetical protein
MKHPFEFFLWEPPVLANTGADGNNAGCIQRERGKRPDHRAPQSLIEDEQVSRCRYRNIPSDFSCRYPGRAIGEDGPARSVLCRT